MVLVCLLGLPMYLFCYCCCLQTVMNYLQHRWEILLLYQSYLNKACHSHFLLFFVSIFNHGRLTGSFLIVGCECKVQEL